MRPSVFLTVTIGLLLASLLSADAESVRNKLATDTAKIETLKQHKIVREDQRGVLITESRDPEIIQLVNEENVIRQKQYQEVIKQKCLEKWPQNRRMRNNCIEEMLQNK